VRVEIIELVSSAFEISDVTTVHRMSPGGNGRWKAHAKYTNKQVPERREMEKRKLCIIRHVARGRDYGINLINIYKYKWL